MEQNRFKSWVLWLAIAALVVFAVKEIWLVDIGETVSTLMNLLLPILIGFGIINNPENKNSL